MQSRTPAVAERDGRIKTFMFQDGYKLTVNNVQVIRLRLASFRKIMKHSQINSVVTESRKFPHSISLSISLSLSLSIYLSIYLYLWVFVPKIFCTRFSFRTHVLPSGNQPPLPSVNHPNNVQ
jgi:hypothetical protein